MILNRFLKVAGMGLAVVLLGACGEKESAATRQQSFDSETMLLQRAVELAEENRLERGDQIRRAVHRANTELNLSLWWIEESRLLLNGGEKQSEKYRAACRELHSTAREAGLDHAIDQILDEVSDEWKEIIELSYTDIEEGSRRRAEFRRREPTFLIDRLNELEPVD